MKITREDVLRVAELANLELTEAEIAKHRGSGQRSVVRGAEGD